MGAGRWRGISPEDAALWERLKRTIDPLHPVRQSTPPAASAPKAAPSGENPEPVPCVTPSMPPRPTERPVADHGGPRMDRRRFEKLRRGRMQPEARIDLHGMTAERAHAALNGFIATAQARDLRLVLVITGKGRPTDDVMAGSGTHGILRRSVPHWLRMPPNAPRILEVTPAHRRHGGEGALYVYLTRRR
jgi:DNA-nicking Smr family endonuclease